MSWVTIFTFSYSSFRIARTEEKLRWQKNQVANTAPGEAESKTKCNRLKTEKGCLGAVVIYLLHVAGSTWSHPNSRTSSHAGEMSLMSKLHFMLGISHLNPLKQIFQMRFLSWVCILNLGVVSSPEGMTEMTHRKKLGQILCMWWEHEEKMEKEQVWKRATATGTACAVSAERNMGTISAYRRSSFSEL